MASEFGADGAAAIAVSGLGVEKVNGGGSGRILLLLLLVLLHWSVVVVVPQHGWEEEGELAMSMGMNKESTMCDYQSCDLSLLSPVSSKDFF